MDINELTNIMVKYSLVIRAIPQEITSVYEPRHAKSHPEGVIERLEGWDRDMLVVKRKPKHAGKIIIVECKNTLSRVDFATPKQFFDSVEDAVDSIVKSLE